jgi:hypothetical protein
MWYAVGEAEARLGGGRSRPHGCLHWLRLPSAGEVAAALSGASVTEHFAAQRSRGGTPSYFTDPHAIRCTNQHQIDDGPSELWEHETITPASPVPVPDPKLGSSAPLGRRELAIGTQ